MDFKTYLAIFALLLLTACSEQPLPTGQSVNVDGIYIFANETLPLTVATLSPLDLDKVDTYEKYKIFGDRTNQLIRILNEKNDLFNIPLLDTSREAWTTASRYITEYGPLMDNYNNVVFSAKEYGVNQNEETLKNFYTKAGLFGFETGIIVWAVFYSATYEAVGIAYRSLGFNSFALKCGACISVVLSEAHWAVRTFLVEGSSQVAQKLTEIINATLESDITIEDIKQKYREYSESLISTANDAYMKVTDKEWMKSKADEYSDATRQFINSLNLSLS